MRIALVGQPNSGKSTIFNYIAGYRVRTANFPGVTVTYHESDVMYRGERITIVDLPGIYSLYTGDVAEEEARRYLLSGSVDVIINVVDASVLSRSLELTLELAELRIPMVVCLNMMDEARRKGLEIDVGTLEKILGVPVVPCIGNRGVGIQEMLNRVREARTPVCIRFDEDIERAIGYVAERLPEDIVMGTRRLTAILLLQGDRDALKAAGDEMRELVERAARALTEAHGRDIGYIISSQRHAIAMDLFERAVRVKRKPSVSVRERLDRYLLHPVYGYIILALTFMAMLWVAFFVGDLLSGLIIGPLEGAGEVYLQGDDPMYIVLRGVYEGFIGGVGIVIPYMIPLLAVLGFLEDVGYLSRAAYLLDRLFHRMGLHGKAAGPFLLGYGCTVPAIMATRILESPWDRLRAAILVPMVPCSARSVVILALIGGIFGPWVAMAFYAVNITVVYMVGAFLHSFSKGPSLGLVMEMPDLKMPSALSVAKKTYYVVYEFLLFAWPIIIAGSVVLEAMAYAGLNDGINYVLSPLTVLVLGLPASLGITIVFGIFRKELALLMMAAALGISGDVASGVSGMMSPGQIFTFVTFITFYIPCFSTVVVLWKELGRRKTSLVVLINIGVAIALSLGVRLVFTAVGLF
jgi:ferrous iron transport protein B